MAAGCTHPAAVGPGEGCSLEARRQRRTPNRVSVPTARDPDRAQRRARPHGRARRAWPVGALRRGTGRLRFPGSVGWLRGRVGPRPRVSGRRWWRVRRCGWGGRRTRRGPRPRDPDEYGLVDLGCQFDGCEYPLLRRTSARRARSAQGVVSSAAMPSLLGGVVTSQTTTRAAVAKPTRRRISFAGPGSLRGRRASTAPEASLGHGWRPRRRLHDNTLCTPDPADRRSARVRPLWGAMSPERRRGQCGRKRATGPACPRDRSRYPSCGSQTGQGSRGAPGRLGWSAPTGSAAIGVVALWDR